MENEKAERNVYNGEDYQRDEEDEEMKSFFALIRNFQEARNRRIEELNNELEEANKKKKVRKLDQHEKQQPSWVPKFEWQDFTGEIEFRKPPAIFPSPCNKAQDQKRQRDEDDGSLDLKLTL